MAGHREEKSSKEANKGGRGVVYGLPEPVDQKDEEIEGSKRQAILIQIQAYNDLEKAD